MTYQTIVLGRNNDSSHFPLWKLKVTDSEYQALKEELRNQFENSRNFDEVGEESMLYMAEWFRREYSEGTLSAAMIFQSLYTNKVEGAGSAGNLMYKAARKAAENINVQTGRDIIQFVQCDDERTMYFYSLLYQGGLPLNKMVHQQNNVQQSSNWDRAIRGMVWRNLNFSDTDLPATASGSESIQKFCDQLVDAARAKQYLMMPFYCANDKDKAYEYLTNKIEKISKDKQAQHPFEISWKFDVDEPGKRIVVKYSIDAPQHLDDSFLEQHELQNEEVVTFGIRVGEVNVPGPEYVNKRSFRPFHYEHVYNVDSEVSVVSMETSKLIATDTLDLSDPHVICKGKDDHYHLGKSASGEMQVLFNSDWEVNGQQQITEYICGNEVIYAIPFNEQISLIHIKTNEEKFFAPGKSLIWTECEFFGQSDSYIKECVARADTMRFYRCDDDGNRVRVNNEDVQYWDSLAQSWECTPLIGKCKVRVPDGNNGFATATTFTNFQSPIETRIISSDENTCEMSLSWNTGTLIPACGRRLANGHWKFLKEDMQQEDYVQCVCTPTDSTKSMTIHIHVPFRGFYIYDNFGARVSPNSYIPYYDFQSYRYGVQDEKVIVSYGFKNSEGELLFFDIPENRKQLNGIGFLQSAIGSAALMRKLLDKQAQSVVFANVVLRFTRENHQTEDYFVKEYPYKFKRVDIDEIAVLDSEDKQVDYSGRIVLIPIDTTEDPFVLRKNMEGKYILPLRLRDWNKTLIVSPQRRVLPGLEDISEGKGLTPEQRSQNKEHAKESIKDELEQSTIVSAIWQRCYYWFKVWYGKDNHNYIFPWSSILEFKYIAKDENALQQLVLMLWLHCENEEERNDLRQILLDNERDLALQWYWLKSVCWHDFEGFFKVKSSDMRQYLIPWAASMGIEQLQKCWNNPEDLVGDIMQSFSDYWNELRYSSLSKGINVNNNGLLTEEIMKNYMARMEVPQFEIDENNKLSQISADKGVCLPPDTEECLLSFTDYSPNAKKFGRRVTLVGSHLKGKIDLLSKDLPIRASVIYYFETYPEYFVYFLMKNYHN